MMSGSNLKRRFKRTTEAALLMVSGVLLSIPACAAPEFELRTISSRPQTVTGGDVLAQVIAPSDSSWIVELNGRDVTKSFRPAAGFNGRIGLLSGLRAGRNALLIRSKSRVGSQLEIFNYALTGPVFSGPHQQPFVCQTEANGLGPALDADCSANTVVRYYYKSTEPFRGRSTRANAIDIFSASFKTYDPDGPPPSDVAQTVTSEGRTVNYIVRRELGTINRAVYEIQFLHQPGQPLPTPWARSAGWNGRLVYRFGGGCAAGYHQGTLAGETGDTQKALREVALERGYALTTSTLNVFGNSCNDRVSAETVSMVKEYFTERYGKPRHTIGIGGSGGAMQLQLIAQNHPGLLDGIIAGSSFPDALTHIPPATDCALLHHVFSTSKQRWSDAQKTAVSGFATWRACGKWSILDPQNCDRSIPRDSIYDPIANPRGLRCDIYSNYVNVLGHDPQTGLARRPLDNVGVQYGLAAFNSRKIDAEQFVDLNERIGGYDQDGNIVPTRSAADPEALRVAYEQGLVLTGGGGLGQIPMIDVQSYTEDQGDNHPRLGAFQTRSRLIAATGNADNHVILVGPPIYAGALSDPDDPNTLDFVQRARERMQLMDRWLDNIALDRSAGKASAKVARNRPGELSDGCWQVDGRRIFEHATLGGTSQCNALYPPHEDPRLAAGASPGGDVLKCVLKSISPSDYLQALTSDQLARLRSVFPAGVCDFSRPGVGKALPSVTERLKDLRPIAVAHRSCWQFGPENSLQAIQACIDLGVDAVKVDMRTTKDGVVVLLHDDTLDRMTNASGPLKNYTYAELKDVRLRNGAGGKGAPLTDQRIPTLEAALTLAKGRLLFSLDVDKERNYDQVFKVVAAMGAEDRVIFMLDVAAGSAELQNARFLGKSAFMPIIWQCGHVWRGQGRGQKPCYKDLGEAAADYQRFNPVAFVAFADQRFVDTQAATLAIGGGSDEATWAKNIDRRARFLYTDYAMELVKYLKAKGLR